MKITVQEIESFYIPVKEMTLEQEVKARFRIMNEIVRRLLTNQKCDFVSCL